MGVGFCGWRRGAVVGGVSSNPPNFQNLLPPTDPATDPNRPRLRHRPPPPSCRPRRRPSRARPSRWSARRPSGRRRWRSSTRASTRCGAGGGSSVFEWGMSKPSAALPSGLFPHRALLVLLLILTPPPTPHSTPPTPQIADRVFADFSKRVGVASVREYEESALAAARARRERLADLETQVGMGCGSSCGCGCG